MSVESPSPVALERGGFVGWLESALDQRIWLHALATGVVGAVGGFVLPQFALAAAFAGAPSVIITGAIVLVIGAIVFGSLAAAFHRTRRSWWMAWAVVPWLGLGTFFAYVVLAAIWKAGMSPDMMGTLPWTALVGGVLALLLALMSWAGPQRWLAAVGVVTAMMIMWPQPPGPPEYTGPTQPPYSEPTIPEFKPYGAALADYRPLRAPEWLFPDALMWWFHAIGSTDAAFAMITETGNPAACGPYLWTAVDQSSEAELSCEAVDVDGLAEVSRRTSENGYEITAVIDGTRVRVMGPASTPEAVLIDALRSAVPMQQDAYDAWWDSLPERNETSRHPFG